MKKIKSFFKNNFKVIIGIVAGLMAGGIIVYATDTIYFTSQSVQYDNTDSGLEATTVQGAINELYTKATEYNDILSRLSAIEAKIGDSTLTTTSQNLTGGVNELNSNIGILSNLNTITKSSVVGAINEKSSIDYAKINAGNNYSFSGCDIGTVFIVRNNGQSEGYIGIIHSASDYTKIVGTSTNITITISNKILTIAASGSSVIVTVIKKS